MENEEILETVRDFLQENNLSDKFKKWCSSLGLDDNELFDLEEWVD